MYSHNFGLAQDPFSIAPDPRFLFMSDRHREALAHLLYGVTGDNGSGGFVLLTGEIGTGKTTICRCFLEQIPPGCHVAYIFNPKLSVIELLQSICDEFHIAVTHGAGQIASAKDYTDALNAFLLQSHAAGQSCVLIIDEAQNLAPEVLEQLRLLTNLETNERKLLQIVLIGQPELRTMLAQPQLEQLAQRVIARFHLDALDAAETTHYITHRLAVAGHSGALPFDARALQRIHAIAHGVPRRINLLCGRALLGAWATGRQQVDQAVVKRAAAEVFGAEPTGAPRSKTAWTAYALLGLLAVAAAAGLKGWNDTPKAATPASVKGTAPSVAKPASAPVPQAAAGSVATPIETEALLAQLPADIDAAWRDLATVWKIPLPEGDACQQAALQQLQCYHAKRLTLPQLRQLGRPGILSLQLGNTAPVYALLVGLGEQTATLQSGAQQHTVRLVSLGRLWRGDFATFWQPPPGYQPDLHDGSHGAPVDLLVNQLAKIEGTVAPSTPQALDADLRARVRAFQRAQGLEPDGQPGPLTFMQMERAAGTTGPRLQTQLR